MKVRRSEEVRLAIIAEAEEASKNGKTKAEVLKEHGVAPSLYHTWKFKMRKSGTSLESLRSKRPYVEDIVVSEATSDDKCIVIVTKTSNVQNLLREVMR